MNLRKILLILSALIYFVPAFSQGKGKISLDAGYGINYNFFVTSYDELNAFGDAGHLYLYNKNNIGTSGSVELRYGISRNATLVGGFTRTVNGKRRSGGVIHTDFNLFIDDFNFRHINTIYSLGYEQPFSRQLPNLKFNVGLFYIRPQQQEMTIDKFGIGNGSDNFFNIIIQDRNYKTSGLEEMGPYLGLSYQKAIDDKFYLGIKSNVYYNASANVWETATLQPFYDTGFNQFVYMYRSK